MSCKLCLCTQSVIFRECKDQVHTGVGTVIISVVRVAAGTIPLSLVENCRHAALSAFRNARGHV